MVSERVKDYNVELDSCPC